MIDSEAVAKEWRRRAGELDEQAAAARGDGDGEHAAELELCAVEYLQAADELELGELPLTVSTL